MHSNGGGVLRILLVCGLVAAFPIAASSAKIVICNTCDPVPMPITPTSDPLNNLQPNGSDTVTDEFLNLTGSILDDLSFSTTINAGLNPTVLAADGDFTCDAPNGFYLNCAVTYDQASGALTTYYFGVNPPDWHDLPVVVIFEDIVGGGFGNTGIPNLGVFSVELSGWTANLTDTTNPGGVGDDGVLYGCYPGQTTPCTNTTGLPTSFVNSYNVPVNLPEPSAALILLTETFLLAGVLALFGRRLKWNRHFDL